MKPTIGKFLIVSFLAAALIISCHDEIVKPEASGNIQQIGKCNNQGLNKTSAECFEYTFTDDLIIKFCVSGNCCPDSARFLSSYKIVENIITVSVKDIAPNLCKCNCNYTIQAKFTNLEYDSYTVYCIQEFESGSSPLYNKPVKKTN